MVDWFYWRINLQYSVFCTKRYHSNSAIQYFKTVDNNDIIQSEYIGYNFSLEDSSKQICDISANEVKKNEADLSLLTRSVKIEIPTLDKYVTRTRIKKEEEIILPQQKEINLKDPELKNKGLQKPIY
jgi:hypothetical protein